ncbi:transposase, partial [Peptacetobacter hiranonis]
MPRSNVTAKQKLDAVKKILSGEESRRHIGQIYGVAHSSVEEWILKYQIKGENAFSDKFQKVEYSKELKEAAVKAYLNGNKSQNEICKIYGLNSRSPLEQWIKEYNSGKELKSSKSIGGTIMTKNKKTSFEERVEIAQYCIKFGHSYSEAAEKYNISYTQARSYALKYKESGKDALKDKR